MSNKKYLEQILNPTDVKIVSNKHSEIQTPIHSSDHIALFFADQLLNTWDNHLEINGIPVEHVKTLDNEAEYSWESYTVSVILKIEENLIQLDYRYSSWDDTSFEDAFFVEATERVVTYTDYRRLNPNFVV